VVSVTAGWNFSLALRGDGTVAAWGVDDAGQTEVPSGLTNVRSLAADMEYCLALKSDGTVTAWGRAPQPPAGLNGVKAIAAGQNHCLAILSNGTIAVWGADDSGQLDVPGTVAQASAIGAGWNYSVALASGSGVILPGFMLRNSSWTKSGFSASLVSQANTSYVLQYKTALTDQTWINLSPVNGTGQAISLFDSGATNSHRFYRVRAQ
jgi:hypothetical protein